MGRRPLTIVGLVNDQAAGELPKVEPPSVQPPSHADAREKIGSVAPCNLRTVALASSGRLGLEEVRFCRDHGAVGVLVERAKVKPQREAAEEAEPRRECKQLHQNLQRCFGLLDQESVLERHGPEKHIDGVA